MGGSSAAVAHLAYLLGLARSAANDLVACGSFAAREWRAELERLESRVTASLDREVVS